MKSTPLQLHTEPFTIQRTWEADEIPVLSASVSIPHPVHSDKAIFHRIRRFYDLQARSFLRYCEQDLFPAAAAQYQAALAASAPLPHLQASLSYQVTYNENGFWSLYTQSCEPSLSGHAPSLLRRGDTWSLSTGYPAALSSFFPPRAKWKKRLLEAAAQEICRQERAGISAYDPTWSKRLRRCFNSRNYYLTSDGLAFFFPMYSIASATEKIPVFTLPYEALDLPFQNHT